MRTTSMCLLLLMAILVNPLLAEEPMSQDAPENLRNKSEQYWRERLTPEQYRVCRESGTERPFSGTYCNFKLDGRYECAACGAHLFSSDDKFDSGTGWPSFTQAAEDGVLEFHEDRTHGMVRTEVRCSRCGSHLGHVFDDGPPPTHKRFCINSLCLKHSSGK